MRWPSTPSGVRWKLKRFLVVLQSLTDLTARVSKARWCTMTLIGDMAQALVRPWPSWSWRSPRIRGRALSGRVSGCKTFDGWWMVDEWLMNGEMRLCCATQHFDTYWRLWCFFWSLCQGCHPLRNLAVYNTALKACAEAQEWEKALTMMAEMKERLCLEPVMLWLPWSTSFPKCTNSTRICYCNIFESARLVVNPCGYIFEAYLLALSRNEGKNCSPMVLLIWRPLGHSFEHQLPKKANWC